MSVSEPIRVVGPFVGDGVLVELDFDFETLAVSDISVRTYDAEGDELTLTLNTDYTVTLNPGSAGGTVTLSDPLAVGFEAFVNGDAMPYTRTGNIITNPGGFFPSIVNAALDRVHIALLQLATKVGRALTLPVDPTAVAGRFPVVLPDGSFGWSSGTGADDGLREDLAESAALVGFKQDGGDAVPLTVEEALRAVEVTPQQFGAVGDATYNPTTKRWSGTDDTAALVAWLQHPNRKKRAPAANYLFSTPRLAMIDGATFSWDADAWLCANEDVDTGGLWIEGNSGIRADRLQVDMRGAPWADSGAGQVNDAVTIVGCSGFNVGLIQCKAVYDVDNIDATNCRGDSGIMLSQSTDIVIETVVAEGFPDAAVYMNGDGQTAGVANSPLTGCRIGRVIALNCANGVTSKRAADNFTIGEVYADGADQVVSVEDVAPTVGSARNWRIDRVAGVNIRLNGVIARYADGGSIGYVDVKFAERPAGLSGAAVRCGVDIQGAKGFVIGYCSAIFDGSDGASQSAGVMIEERSGTFCEDVAVLGGYTDGAFWRVRENETTHLRTRVFAFSGVGDGTSESVSLRNASCRHFHVHADGSFLVNTDIRFTKTNTGLYARDVDGTYRNLLIDAAQTILTMSGAAWGAFNTNGIALEAGKFVSVGGLQVLQGRGAAVTAPTGGATIDTQARTAIGDLIARLQGHGLIG